MGTWSAVLIATLQYACGFIIFKRPDENALTGLWISTLFVLTSGFLTLWTLTLYPRKFQKLNTVSDFLVQYLFSCFILEYFMAVFWFPWEKCVMDFFPWVARHIDEMALRNDKDFSSLTEFLKREDLGLTMSLVAGLMIFVATLHATQVVNFSLICSEGFGSFLQDTSRRIEKFTMMHIPTSLKSKTTLGGRLDCIPGEEDDFEEENPNHYMPELEVDEPGDRITEYHFFRRR